MGRLNATLATASVMMIIAVVCQAGAESALDRGPFRFPDVPPPKTEPVLPRSVAEVLPDEMVAGTAFWMCRNDPAFTARFSPEETERLLALAAVLDRTKNQRLELLNARTEHGDTVAGAYESFVGEVARLGDDLIHPGLDSGRFVLGSDAVERSWRRAEQKAWSVLVEPGPQCSVWAVDAARGTLELAHLIVQNDRAAAQTEVNAERMASDQYALLPLLSRRGLKGAALEQRLQENASARRTLFRLEDRWNRTSAEIGELLRSVYQIRALQAAWFSDALADVVETMSDRGDRLMTAALTVEIHRLREYSAREYPSLFAIHSTMLDRTGLSQESSRWRIVGDLEQALSHQIPLVAALYRVRMEREGAFKEFGIADTSLGQLRQETEVLWYRLWLAARMVNDERVSKEQRGWAWTEVGRLRDRLSSLEQILAGLEVDLARKEKPSKDSFEETPFFTTVTEQDRVVEQIVDGRRGEPEMLAALGAYADGMRMQASDALRSLSETVTDVVPTVRYERAREALSVLRAALEERRRIEDTLAEMDTAMEEAGLGPGIWSEILTFGQVADAFRSLPSLERLVEEAPHAHELIARLAEQESERQVDILVLEIAGTLGLPMRPNLSVDRVALVLEENAVEFEISRVIPSRMRAGIGATRSPWQRTAEISPEWSPVHAVNRGPASPVVLPAANTPGDGPDPFWEKGPWRPPSSVSGWAGDVLSETWGDIKANAAGYVVSGAVTGVGIVMLNPVIAGAGVGMGFANLLKDTTTGVAKGAIEQLGPDDPATRDRWKKNVDRVRWWADLATIVVPGKTHLTIARQLADSAGAGGTFIDLVRGSGPVNSGPVDCNAMSLAAIDLISTPYADRRRCAERFISQASGKMEVCTSGEWAEIRDLLDNAAVLDPQKGARNWASVGNRTMRLSRECPGILADYAQISGAGFPPREVVTEIESALYRCDAAAAESTVNRFLAEDYIEAVDCACAHGFLREVEAFREPIGEIQRIQGLMSDAEKTCQKEVAADLARQVLSWADSSGDLFGCSSAMGARADEILQWAGQPESGDGADLLVEARRLIESCRYEEAQDRLAAIQLPTRCAQAGNQQDLEIRKKLLALIVDRMEADARFESLRANTIKAISRCDTGWAESALAEIDQLDICAEGKDEFVQELLRFLDEGSSDDAEVVRTEAVANQAMAQCNDDAVEELFRWLELLNPCLQENMVRKAEIAERLRFFVEQGVDAEGDDRLLAQAKEELNKAVYLMDRACNMTVARRHLENAREILGPMELSSCRSPYLDDYRQVLIHGTFVEEQIVAREALIEAIRGNAVAADAAFNAALQSCQIADLDRSVAHAGEAIHRADSIGVMVGDGCEDLVRVVADAVDLESEAATLRSYWDGIEGDLQSARQAAEEGRAIALEVYCAGVRQKAQPSRCFQAALDECAGLGAEESETDPDLVTPPPPGPPPTTGRPSTGGGGTGRVQVGGTEPCAKDMSWVPARQRFECTCPGYLLDSDLGRCVRGGTVPSPRISQADCDARWPGTVLTPDPSTGKDVCKCPSGAWSESQSACMSLTPGGSGHGPQGGVEDCTYKLGTMPDPITGKCRCTVGQWDEYQRECIDTAAEERQKDIQNRKKEAGCERLYSDIQVFRNHSTALYRQQAIAAEQEARQRGCDPGRIAQAIAKSRTMTPQGGTGGGGGSRGSGGGPGGSGGGSPGGGSGDATPGGGGTATGRTCIISHMDVSDGHRPVGYVVYVIQGPRYQDPDVYGVMTVVTKIEDEGQVHCSGAIDCLRFVDVAGGYQAIGSAHSSFSAAEGVVKQRCPNPRH